MMAFSIARTETAQGSVDAAELEPATIARTEWIGTTTGISPLIRSLERGEVERATRDERDAGAADAVDRHRHADADGGPDDADAEGEAGGARQGGDQRVVAAVTVTGMPARTVLDAGEGGEDVVDDGVERHRPAGGHGEAEEPATGGRAGDADAGGDDRGVRPGGEDDEVGVDLDAGRHARRRTRGPGRPTGW